MSILAIIPARSGSKGIPGKNFTALLGGTSPLQRAYRVAQSLLPDARIVITTDVDVKQYDRGRAHTTWLPRPAELAQDDTPMIAVVQHVLEQIPGPPDQKIVLLQPTQPLRKPEHITKALQLLTPEWDSVVSVVQTVSPDELLETRGDELKMTHGWTLEFPSRRQVLTPGYKRDGTVYAFWRRTVDKHRDIYGGQARALIIDPAETCPLDTIDDWQNAERRLRERA